MNSSTEYKKEYLRMSYNRKGQQVAIFKITNPSYYEQLINWKFGKVIFIKQRTYFDSPVSPSNGSTFSSSSSSSSILYVNGSTILM